MNGLMKMVYEEKEVRTFTKDDGSIWFVAADVCEILGLENTTAALSGLDEHLLLINVDEAIKGLRSDAKLINEPGLYELIFKSRKPEAKAFRDWVFTEVLPSIRKYGFYMTPELRTFLELHPEAAANFGQYLLDSRNAMYDENHGLYKKINQIQRALSDKTSYAVKVLDIVKLHAPKEVELAEGIIKLKEGMR